MGFVLVTNSDIKRIKVSVLNEFFVAPFTGVSDQKFTEIFTNILAWHLMHQGLFPPLFAASSQLRYAIAWIILKKQVNLNIKKIRILFQGFLQKFIELEFTSCDDRPDGCQLKPRSNEANFFLKISITTLIQSLISSEKYKYQTDGFSKLSRSMVFLFSCSLSMADV